MDYDLLCAQLKGLAEADGWYVPLLSNAAALLYDALADVNWAGFYLMRDGKLVLGPFQGKVACIHIPAGRASAARRRPGTRPCGCRTCTPSRGTSPATAPPTPRSSFPSTAGGGSSACWTSTARYRTASPPPTRRGWRPSSGRWRSASRSTLPDFFGLRTRPAGDSPSGRHYFRIEPTKGPLPPAAQAPSPKGKAFGKPRGSISLPPVGKVAFAKQMTEEVLRQ